MYTRTEENLKNLSIAQKAVGRVSMPENCKNTGRTHFKKGFIPWNKGLKGYGSFNKGKKRTEAMNQKQSLIRKKRFETQDQWNKGRKLNEAEVEKMRQYGLKGLIKQQNMKEPTSIEKKVYEELKNRGLLFEKQKLINGKFLVDAYIPSLNLVIEADGDYWHSLDRVVKKDRAENAYLTKCGFNLLRLSETEINNGEYKSKIRKGVN